MVVRPKKSLGQHWLTDPNILNEIAYSAELESDDTVLEIGPGLGTLTQVLIEKSAGVIAVELDVELANNLADTISDPKLEVVNEDILQFDLESLPQGYKVVANVPYYITSKILQHLLTAKNKPSKIVLLVQKEVAERIVAKDGKMSILAVSAQLYCSVKLGIPVHRSLFNPPPKVDSQVVILEVKPNIPIENENHFFRVVKAGFSAKRKKLRTSLAGGLGIPKDLSEKYLMETNIDPNSRAETLSIDDWMRLSKVVPT